MLKNKIFLFLPLLILRLSAQEINSSTPVKFLNEKKIEVKDLQIKAKIQGSLYISEIYDIVAPFEGRIDTINNKEGDYVKPETPLAQMVKKDVADFLDIARNSDTKTQKKLIKNWKGKINYFDINSSTPGIITKIYVSSKDYVNQGDKLFTIATRMQLVATNIDPMQIPPSIGMTAEMHLLDKSEIKSKFTLKEFIDYKDKPYFYRLWFDTDDLKSMIKSGDKFEGELILAESKNAKVVKRNELIMKGNKRYLLIEVETGLLSKDEAEVLSPTLNYLSPQKEDIYGKPSKK